MNLRTRVGLLVPLAAATLAAAGWIIFNSMLVQGGDATGNKVARTRHAQVEARATQGEVAAQLTLAHWHLGETGQPCDYSKAAHWLTKAARTGNAEAEYLLGTLCEAGRGMRRSATNALHWFAAAAAQDHAGAHYSLGSMYAAGRGVPQDSTKAAQHYLRASELGDALAQFNVAQRYELGRGVATNLVEAWKWYKLAAAGGVMDAERGRKQVELHLGSVELTHAQHSAEEFRQNRTKTAR